MSIAEQFAGLQMDQLIGSPLRAAADASTQLANSTADFINRVGFDSEGKVRTVAFAYQKRSINEDGTSNLDEMKVDVPMLAIVPIPNLQVDEVNILFDMEVKQSERSESSMDMGATISGTVNLGIVKVNVTGSVSAHQSNTRSSDNSAKYHVDVRATNHGTPEGLARVLDMMAANVAPALVGSTIQNGNGQNLTGEAKERAERLKAIRQEISQIETRLNAAKGGLDSSIQQLKRLATTQHNSYQAVYNKLTADDTLSDEKRAEYSDAINTVNQSWSTFQNQTAELVKLAADSGAATGAVADVFALKALDATGVVKNYTEGDYYDTVLAAQNKAMDAQKTTDGVEQELLDKKAEYSDIMASKALPGN